MSFVYAYTCDACGSADNALPAEDHMFVRQPREWRKLDGRDFCSLACLAVYAANPDAVPKPEYAPGFAAAIAASLRQKSVN